MVEVVVEENVSLRDYLIAKIDACNLHFEARINSLETHISDVDKQKEIARTLALQELERRLADLNHAHQRAADVLQTYLPREVFEKFREADSDWKRADEVLRSTFVSEDEFRTYKETTQQALTLSVGKSAGIGSVWGAVVIIFSVLAAIGTISTAVITLFVKHS